MRKPFEFSRVHSSCCNDRRVPCWLTKLLCLLCVELNGCCPLFSLFVYFHLFNLFRFCSNVFKRGNFLMCKILNKILPMRSFDISTVSAISGNFNMWSPSNIFAVVAGAVTMEHWERNSMLVLV